jgi:hypothetical protein
MQDAQPLYDRIVELQIEHRDLDVSLLALQSGTPLDELTIRRMKKRKLVVKDAIMHLQRQMVPDTPA